MAKIHFLNVDEGDCTIIQHDNGKVTMMAQFKFSVASPRGANQKMVQHDTG